MNFAEMTVSELCGWIVGGIVALSAIIQISPIKLNPWSWIAKKIGKAINSEVIEKVNKLELDIGDMRTTFDEYAAKDARSKILRFGDELLHDLPHSKESFDDMLDVITDYEQYCEEHPTFKNKKTARTVEHIVAVYDKCMADHTFQ